MQMFIQMCDSLWSSCLDFPFFLEKKKGKENHKNGFCILVEPLKPLGKDKTNAQANKEFLGKKENKAVQKGKEKKIGDRDLSWEPRICQGGGCEGGLDNVHVPCMSVTKLDFFGHRGANKGQF